MSYLSVLKTFPVLLTICALVVYILRRYVPILTTTTGTILSIVLVPMAAVKLETLLKQLLMSEEDRLFLKEFKSELKDQFCRLDINPSAKWAASPITLTDNFKKTNKVCGKHKSKASPSLWNEYCEPSMIELEVHMFLQDNPKQSQICGPLLAICAARR